MGNFKKTCFWFVVVLLIALFCYFRLKPIYFQTVPYTFDQGRDFLKAEEIVLEKNLTLIGPTTGIQGVFHGAWWYYYLAVPYIILQGHPLGFPLFIFLTFLAASFLFFTFVKKEFDPVPSLVFLAFCAVSPYLIGISFFAISSFPNLPLFLALFYITYKALREKSGRWVFLSFLTLGFILETELPTGAFLIPAYVLTVVVTKNGKRFFGTLRRIGLTLLGLIIPVAPRLLFEVKNNFLQTKNVLNALHNAGPSTKRLLEVFWERVDLFRDYYFNLFPGDSLIIAVLFLAATIVGFLYILQKNLPHKKYFLFILILLSGTFLLTLLYKNVFFANYLEGLSLFYVLLIVLSFSALSTSENQVLKTLPLIGLLTLLTLGLFSFYKDVRAGKPKFEGAMKTQISIVEHIYKNVRSQAFCARVYTPPVIPHTYHYLFNYYSRRNHFQQPDYRFIKNCWIILERNECKFRAIEVKERLECEARIENWKKDNIPKNSIMKSRYELNKVYSVEYWERK